MPYLGNTPADKYSSYSVQHFTTSATTSYTLDFPVANENEIELFINNVRQEPGSSYAYTASGTSLTLSAATSASDTMYCVFQGKSTQTVAPATGSVTNAMLSSGSFSNITGTGTLTNFTSTGIDDNASSTAMTINSSQSIAIGTTSPSRKLHVENSDTTAQQLYLKGSNASAGSGVVLYNDAGQASVLQFNGSTNTGLSGANSLNFGTLTNNRVAIYENNIERMRFDGNNINIGTTDGDVSTNTGSAASDTGINLQADGRIFTGVAGSSLRVNRMSDDGDLISFRQDGTQEGNIQVSGTTVSYLGFTGSHWSRLSDNSKPTILRGTILESLDEMMDWYQVQFDVNGTTKKESYSLQEGEVVGDTITHTYKENNYTGTIIKEGDVKHSKCKVSDTLDSKAVYGVFVSWDNDDDTVNDMHVAQTGTFVVRINSAETVSKGDLIQSNGDGTGKVQSDDIIRASTVAKVLSTTKIETYEDGSYIVPCSLHC